tara:strand:- start:1108 stop:1392 length:285 start_codon:yes stop_codon:yes gene_type:complete
MKYELLTNEILREEMRNYFEQGIMPGNFCYSLLTNDLLKSIHTADKANMRNIKEIVHWLFEQAPINRWGSEKLVVSFLKRTKIYRRTKISETPI